jgi:DNA-3-methyladenine glycosylase II
MIYTYKMQHPLATKAELQRAAKHLASDPALAPLIARYGLCTFEPHAEYYRALVDSIIGQQLSVKAARTIKQRFRDLFGDDFPQPEAILVKNSEELRSAGLSGQKATYIRDLAQHIVDGKVQFDRLDQQGNEEIIRNLTDVKGIGEWTVHMFLMFCMGRLDVLATGDLGVRTAVKNQYNVNHLPAPAEVTAIAEQNNWHPYESAACWYLWRSLDNAPI